VPAVGLWLLEHGFTTVFGFMVKAKMAFSPYLKWALQNSMWVMGTSNLSHTLATLRDYTLRDVAALITSDVLILAGAEDHFVPAEQIRQFEDSLTGARSVTTVAYDRESGGAEHCQLGAITLWHATFFDWLAEKFPHS
jgi:hypothetical protein